MIVTYLRSSSIGAHSLCPHQYFLTYTLGLPSKAGKAAALGNCLHKAMELLAWVSYHKAHGNAEFDEESFGRLRVADITPELATEMAYAHYRNLESHVKFNDRYDLPKCHEWTQRAITMWGGYFDPRNQVVIEPEKRFDITLEEPWARYEYDTPQGHFEGQLSIKGTMDLIVADKHEQNEIELIDYKSGRRKDWAIDDERASIKTWPKLMKDQQLLLYFLACRRLYPGRTIHTTILFVNDMQLEDGTVVRGGPFRLCMGDEHEEMALKVIREKFEAIKNTQHPEARWGLPCRTFCAFGIRSRAEQDPTKTICNYWKDQVQQKGADQVFYEIGNMNTLMRYSDGGGRKAKDE